MNLKNWNAQCQERYWQTGIPNPHFGYPREYLPGDAPGWMCKITEGGCAETPVDCPLWEKRHEGIYLLDDIYYNDFTGEFWEKEICRACGGSGCDVCGGKGTIRVEV